MLIFFEIKLFTLPKWRSMASKKHILIAGGTGLVGKRLLHFLSPEKYVITLLSRNPRQRQDGIVMAKWDTASGYMDPALKSADIIINLAGEGIADKLWTTRRKKELIDSRVQSTDLLNTWIQSLDKAPELYLSASAVGFYGHRGTASLTETSESGNEFLSQCCQLWEEAAIRVKPNVSREVILRIGIVLSMKGGALPKMLMTRFSGFLSCFGNGLQYYPWIHIDDLCSVMAEAVENDRFDGVYNAVAPQEITQKDMMKEISGALGLFKFIIPVPAILLKLAMGEMSKVVLNSNRVIPEKLIQEGFRFSFTSCGEAVKDLLGRKI